MKHGDIMTCLQNDLGVFKIEGPHPFKLYPGNHLGNIFPRPGSRLIVRCLQSEEGHDAGGVLG